MTDQIETPQTSLRDDEIRQLYAEAAKREAEHHQAQAAIDELFKTNLTAEDFGDSILPSYLAELEARIEEGRRIEERRRKRNP